MFAWLLNWRRSIVIVGFIALLLLLGGRSFLPETRLLWGGWWVQQQSLPQTTGKTIRRTVKLPSWYLRFQAIIRAWRVGQREELVLRGVCYLLAFCAVGWVWLLRWSISQMLKGESEPFVEGNWGWAGGLPNQTATMQVRLQVVVSAAGEQEGTDRQQVKQLPSQVGGEATEIESSPDKPGIAWSPKLMKPAETKRSGANQVEVSQPMLLEGSPPVRMVEETGQESGTKSGLPAPIGAIMHHFSKLDDPRVERTKKHQLFDIVVITICAVIGGADTWVEVAEFGQDKEQWFKTFLDLPNGIPSHDTLGRVFRRLDPQQWQAGFLSWIQAVNQVTKGQIVPIDGKMLRRSHDKTLGKKAIHMVSAWASENRMVLGQVKVDEKSNEITAIPILLDMLAISGCIVTIDAMGCQKDIASKIIDKKAHYVLALKGNQSGLHQDVMALFAKFQLDDFAPAHYHKTEENSHGRLEIRQCWTISDPKELATLHNLPAWKGLQSVVRVRAERLSGNKLSVEDRYYISSLPGDAKHLLQAVRGHWSIENSLHWVLDIAFAEDECRIRKGHGPQNFAVLRHLALNLLKQETTVKSGIKAKRKKAGRNQDYLLKVLAGFT